MVVMVVLVVMVVVEVINGRPGLCKNKNLFNGHSKYPGDIMRQFQRWIVFILFKKNNGLSSHVHFPGQIVLCKIMTRPEFPDTVSHF